MKKVHESHVKGKVYRLIFQMNKNVRVKIQTPVGVTWEANTGPIVSQGGIDSAIISSVSIGNDVGEAFANNESVEVITYESVPLAPMCYMDDIFNMNESASTAQAGNELMEEIIGEKGLEFNHDKSMYIIMGNRKART